MIDIVSLDDLEAVSRTPVFEREPRIVRLSLEAGDEIPGHRHPDATVVVHVLAGRLSLRLDGDPHEVGAGELVRFDGSLEVAIDAPEDATALVMLVPAGDGG